MTPRPITTGPITAGLPVGLVAGVDEAGRGPLAGPVCAAAVILDPGRVPVGVADSKTLPRLVREHLAGEIEQMAIAYAIAFASAAEIDALNILQATMLAMRRAVLALNTAPEQVLIDGNRCPDGLPCPAQAIVRGDRSVAAISAASILAKVARDRLLVAFDARYPGYDFGLHKGYPTKAHLAALARLGPCAEHRRTFGPVRAVLAASPPRSPVPASNVKQDRSGPAGPARSARAGRRG